nr:MAG TPA: hypothetical protein [Caudoviricetes sp.]
MLSPFLSLLTTACSPLRTACGRFLCVLGW